MASSNARYDNVDNVSDTLSSSSEISEDEIDLSSCEDYCEEIGGWGKCVEPYKFQPLKSVSEDRPSDTQIEDIYAQVSLFNEMGAEPNCSNSKEKADIDNGIGEKAGCHSKSVIPIMNQNCEYQKQCGRVKAMLGLPEGYFISDNVCCFCEICHRVRNDPPTFQHGDPSRCYSTPFGWCRFSLRTQSKNENTDKWHIAFHGTNSGTIRKILDNGTLLLPGKLVFGNILVKQDVSEKQSFETNHVLMSPSITYAASPHFSPQHELIDGVKRKNISVKVVIQVYVRPGSYNTGPSRDCHHTDPHFSNKEIEWYTKETNATVLHSLLIKVGET
ncbi:Neuralized-like protein 4 [Nymphon striatum]|nr:Neuralized-like protein 4 [Nymphon striatum]